MQQRPALSTGVILAVGLALADGATAAADGPWPPSSRAPTRREQSAHRGKDTARAADRDRRPVITQTLVTSSPLPDITPTTESGRSETVRLEFATRSQALTLAQVSSTPGSEPRQSALLATLALLSVVMAAVSAVIAWRFPDQARKVKAVTAANLLRGIEVGERLASGLRNRFDRWRAGARLAQSRKSIADPKAANAVATVSAMLTDAQCRLGDLKGAGPLNDVLTLELGQLRSRLSTLELAASASEDAAQRASPGFRNLVRDIERVRRIADSAALSIGGERSPTRIPATRAEAYDLLGLNPDVADATLKKVADGLRMSWHPDHARDDADRVQREARIKAINIAIDLIHGKRVAA